MAQHNPYSTVVLASTVPQKQQRFEIATRVIKLIIMKTFIVLSALVAVTLAKPSAPIALAYAAPVYAKLLPGAPIGLDGRVVDTPEVSFAKAEHAAAHLNEKLSHAKEALKSADLVALAAPAPIIATSYSAVASPAIPLSLTKSTPGGAPIGLDGRVVDTPEVAFAKAEHAAAHLNHQLEHGQEFLKNSIAGAPLLYSPYAAHYYYY